MKLYVIFWIGLAICTISSTELTIENGRDLYHGENMWSEHTLRIIIAASTFIGVLYILMSCLELIMLYAYYRMGVKLSKKTKKLVTKSFFHQDT